MNVRKAHASAWTRCHGVTSVETAVPMEPVDVVRQQLVDRWRCGSPELDELQSRFLRAVADVKVLLGVIRDMEKRLAEYEGSIDA